MCDIPENSPPNGASFPIGGLVEEAEALPVNNRPGTISAELEQTRALSAPEQLEALPILEEPVALTQTEQSIVLPSEELTGTLNSAEETVAPVEEQPTTLPSAEQPTSLPSAEPAAVLSLVQEPAVPLPTEQPVPVPSRYETITMEDKQEMAGPLPSKYETIDLSSAEGSSDALKGNGTPDGGKAPDEKPFHKKAFDAANGYYQKAYDYYKNRIPKATRNCMKLSVVAVIFIMLIVALNRNTAGYPVIPPTTATQTPTTQAPTTQTTTTQAPSTTTQPQTTATRTTTTPSTTTTTRQTTTTTTQVTTTTTVAPGPVKPRALNPYPYHYFPFISAQAVPFDQAKTECETFEGYSATGVEQTNLKYLESTADLIRKSMLDGVWAGGWLDFDNGNATTVFWADGRITDSTKAPGGVFCLGNGAPAQTIRYNASIGQKGVRVPFVRYRATPHCLSMHNDLSKIFPTLCAQTRASVSIKDASNNVVVPSFYLNDTGPLFDKASESITELGRRIGCILNSAGVCVGSETQTTYSRLIPIRVSRPQLMITDEFKYYPAGFSLMVDFKTAEAICTVARHGFETTPSQLITYNLINKNIDAFTGFDAMRDSFTYSFTQLLPGNIMATGGLFNFTPGAATPYNKLLWNLHGQYQVADSYVNNIPWCDSHNPSTRIHELYAQFMDYYKNTIGSRSNGQHYVHVVVGSSPFPTACLRLVDQELYWPGFNNFLPTCQVLRP